MSGADEARNAARKAIARGALIIKITASGGVVSPLTTSTPTSA